MKFLTPVLLIVILAWCPGLSAGTIDCNGLSLQNVIANAATEADACLIGNTLFYGFSYSASPSAFKSASSIAISTVNDLLSPAIAFTTNAQLQRGTPSPTAILDILFMVSAAP